MRVQPYSRPPVAPTLALLTAERDVVTLAGELLDLDDLPKQVRVVTDYDTARALTLEGFGEALCWNAEEIKWRHRRFEDGWTRRASDVAVIRLPFGDRPERTLKALDAWRGWLMVEGGSPPGTTGGAAWSLLRATLAGTLRCSVGFCPPIRQTLGGRRELGPAGQGRFQGPLSLVDLPAAYASELGGLRYGGVWLETGEPERWASQGLPVFVRAKVRVPDIAYGPLPRRSRRREFGQSAFFFGATFPTATTLQGVWTWQELEAAVRWGCKIVKLLGAWVHRASGLPFAGWWSAIQRGRELDGLAGTLAKLTGNALWGRFCMDARLNGVKTIRSRNGTVSQRPVAVSGGPVPAHDLAETVSGRVRARLYDRIMQAGDKLVSAHTDGAWLSGTVEELDGWRLKGRARRLDVLDPQVLRYWPSPARASEPWVVFAGVPAGLAGETFERRWAEQGFAA